MTKTYDITPEATENIRQEIVACDDTVLCLMLSTYLEMMRNKKILAEAVERGRKAGLTELTEARAHEYNAAIMTMLLEELNVRVKGSAYHGH